MAGEHGMTKGDIRNQLRVACSRAHGVGREMSLLELCALVLERGLPDAEERERILERKLAEGEGDTTTSSSPGSVDGGDPPDATARR